MNHSEISYYFSIPGDIIITDQDRPRQGYLITFADTSAKDTFFINGTKLYVLNSKQLDYEVKQEVNVKVKVVEIETRLELIQTVTMAISNANEPPCCVTFSNGATLGSVMLGSKVGTVIGKLAVQDDDVGDTHTFSLIPSKHSAVDNTSLEIFR